ncbi:MAG: 30S ribosomal protein S2 [Candidatus Komeilibacteria bacterium]|nr:30S ribosomal protein S2 [Candidatus Komeilibacteria bacterium]
MSIELLDLLQAGVHFGHSRSKRHPNMEPYIFGVKQNIHIIDLEQTKAKLEEAMKFVQDITSKGGVILFVSGKKQAQDLVKKAAIRAGMPYINTRWLGGTFTNFENIHSLPKKLKRMEEEMSKGLWDRYTKKEALEREREMLRLKEMVEGIKNMDKLPQAVFIVDIKKDDTAVHEAHIKKVPVIAICDTNTNPEKVDFAIPGNDDAIKSIEYITERIADACLIGKGKK